jgi:hypothetical protein
LDERDTVWLLTRADLHSQDDETAAAVVATGGGIEAIVEATELRSRENALSSIDPAILVRAFTNDAAAAAAAETEPNRDRLRRLVPDPAPVRRRAAGESLRALARDYQVAHTTLACYFRRPPVAQQLRSARRLARANHPQPKTRTKNTHRLNHPPAPCRSSRKLRHLTGVGWSAVSSRDDLRCS